MPVLNRHQHQSHGPKVGEPAPEFKLPDLSGRTRDLADLRGTDTLLLFWNPACGFCQQMLPDLKAWEAQHSEGSPALLLISRGEQEENQAMGLNAPIVLDQEFRVGRTFGASGTPMAILVDSEGQIAAELAAGRDQVLRLLQSPTGRRSQPARSAAGT